MAGHVRLRKLVCCGGAGSCKNTSLTFGAGCRSRGSVVAGTVVDLIGTIHVEGNAVPLSVVRSIGWAIGEGIAGGGGMQGVEHAGADVVVAVEGLPAGGFCEMVHLIVLTDGALVA